MGTIEYNEHRFSCPRSVKLSLILFRPLNIFSFYLELYKINHRNLIRTSKFKCSFRWRCHISFKFWLEYCKYSMSLVIFKSPLSEIILIFCLRTWDIHVCINMKKYLVCQTIDYMQMSYDYEYKELSIPFWSTCLSSPLKYFMGVWSFVIVYFQ